MLKQQAETEDGQAAFHDCSAPPGTVFSRRTATRGRTREQLPNRHPSARYCAARLSDRL
jgi:hypothetical protein